MRWGDGWLPVGVSPENIKKARATLSELAETIDRDPNSISITVFGQPPDKDLIEQFEEAGADRVLLRLSGDNEQALLSDAEQKASAVFR